jgi:hypothetical protein
MYLQRCPGCSPISIPKCSAPPTTSSFGRSYARPAKWRRSSRGYSIAGRAMAGGSRPASSQAATAAASGTPTTMRTR